MLNVWAVCLIELLAWSRSRYLFVWLFFLMMPRPPGSTQGRSAEASDGFKGQDFDNDRTSFLSTFWTDVKDVVDGFYNIKVVLNN